MHFTQKTRKSILPNTFCNTNYGIYWEKNKVVIIINVFYNFRVIEIGIIKWYCFLCLCGPKKEHHTKEKKCFFHIYIFLI